MKRRKPIYLAPVDRAQLELWLDLPKNSRVAVRARIILTCAKTADLLAVASACSVSLWAAYRCRKLFEKGGPTALLYMSERGEANPLIVKTEG